MRSFCHFCSSNSGSDVCSVGLISACQWGIDADLDIEDHGQDLPPPDMCIRDTRVPVEQPRELDRLHRSSVIEAETMVIGLLYDKLNCTLSMFLLNRSVKWKTTHQTYGVMQYCYRMIWTQQLMKLRMVRRSSDCS